VNASDRDLLSCYVGEFSALRTLVEEHVKQGNEYRQSIAADINEIKHTLRGKGGDNGLCTRMRMAEGRIKWLWAMFSAAMIAAISSLFRPNG